MSKRSAMALIFESQRRDDERKAREAKGIIDDITRIAGSSTLKTARERADELVREGIKAREHLDELAREGIKARERMMAQRAHRGPHPAAVARGQRHPLAGGGVT